MPKYLVEVSDTEKYLYTVEARDATEAKKKAYAEYLYDPEPVMVDGEIATDIRVEVADGDEDENVPSDVD